MAQTGEAVPGASILVKNTTIGTVSDIDGTFSLEADKNTQPGDFFCRL